MLPQILFLLSLISILFITAIGVVIFFHFREFTLPEDKMAKRFLNILEIGTLFLILFNVILLAFNILKK
jgi:hypothetical protein